MSKRRRTHEMTWTEYVRWLVGNDRQVDVAERTGVDQTTISRWLKADADDRPRVSPGTVSAFARGYGRSVLEAFVVAGIIDADDAEIAAPVTIDLSTLTDDELTDELRRRIISGRRLRLA